jgi:hypothetical protein
MTFCSGGKRISTYVVDLSSRMATSSTRNVVKSAVVVRDSVRDCPPTRWTLEVF